MRVAYLKVPVDHLILPHVTTKVDVVDHNDLVAVGLDGAVPVVQVCIVLVVLYKVHVDWRQ